MLWNLKKSLIEIIKNKNYNYIINNNSLEERIEFLENFEKYQDRVETIITELSNELGIEAEEIVITLFTNYFTEEEALEIYNNTDNEYLKLYSAINLSDKEKDKHINEPPYDESLKKAMIETYSDLIQKAEYQKRVEVEEYIKDLNDFEKVEYMKNLSNEHNKLKVLITLEDDELIYKLMQRFKISNIYINDILKNIYNNDIKVKIITDDRYSDYINEYGLFETLPEPHLIEVLKYFLINKKESFSSYTYKKNIYNLSNEGKVKLFLSEGFSFNKESNFLNQIFFEELEIDDNVALALVKMFKEDRISLEHLMYIDNDKLRYELLTDVDIKLDNNIIKQIFMSIKNDEYKILCIPDVSHIISALDILKSIKDVDTKIRMLESIPKNELGQSLNSVLNEIFTEEGKVKALLSSNIRSNLSSYDIYEIAKYFNDDNKFIILNNVPNIKEEFVVDLIKTMSDDAKRKILDNNMYFTLAATKASIVGSLRKIEDNDIIKLEYLKDLLIQGKKDGSSINYILNKIFPSLYDESLIYEIISEYLTNENIIDKVDFTLQYLKYDKYDEFRYSLIDEVVKNNPYNDFELKTRIRNLMNSLTSEEYIFKCIEEYGKEIDSDTLIGLIERLRQPIYDDFKIKFVKENIKEKRVSGILNTITDINLVINMFNSVTDLDDEKKIIVITNLKSSEYDNYKCDLLDSLLNSNNIKELSVLSLIDSLKNDEYKLKYLMLSNNFNKLNEFILHNDFIRKYNIINKDLIKLYSLKYEVNYAHLLTLVEKYSYEFLRVLDNPKIKNIINSNDKDFSKLILLFDVQETVFVQDNHIDSVLHALLQKDFRLKNKDIFNKFNTIKNHLFNKEYELAEDELNAIVGYLNIASSDYVTNLLNKNNIDSYSYFLSTLSNENLLDKNLAIINAITNKFILESRNEYANKHYKEFKDSLKLEKSYEKNGLIKLFLRKIDIDNIVGKIIYCTYLLTEEEKDFVNNRELLKDCIKLRRGEETTLDRNIVIENLKMFNNIIDKIYINNQLDGYADESIKVTYNIDCDNSSIIRIMQELNMELLSSKLFNNKELYDNLLNYLRNYRMIGWGNTFSALSDRVDMDLDENTIASFLNNYYVILEKLEEKQQKDYKLTGELRKITLSQFLEEAEVYASDSYKYKKLFGSEDFRLIRTNPPSNAASMSKEERIRLAVEKVKTMYLRDFITIPPSRETIKINENKELTYSVGETTDMMNLTYGERTGACMRIGGAGRTLFDFCLENENGFHVKITNPNTGKLVSRVSGFRNGNTIFLNQLRTSLDSNYSSEDLISGLRKFFDNIINLSKDSEYPIKNVLISSGYAMAVESDKVLSTLNGLNVKEGFEHFYSDIASHNAIRVSSTSETLEPIELGPDNSVKYTPLRQSAKVVDSLDDIINVIDRMHTINEMLLGKNLDEIVLHGEYNDYSNVNKLVFGSDWYIALDSNNNIIEEFVISRENQKEKQTEEMTAVLENIKKLGGNTYD